MTLPIVRQVFMMSLLGVFGCWMITEASPYDQWEDGAALQKMRNIRSEDLSDVLWRDQNEEQVQNIFKRFLFHYSTSRNPPIAVQHQSHAIHPLMHLAAKLNQKKKKLAPSNSCELPRGRL